MLYAIDKLLGRVMYPIANGVARSIEASRLDLAGYFMSFATFLAIVNRNWLWSAVIPFWYWVNYWPIMNKLSRGESQNIGDHTLAAAMIIRVLASICSFMALFCWVYSGFEHKFQGPLGYTSCAAIGFYLALPEESRREVSVRAIVGK